MVCSFVYGSKGIRKTFLWKTLTYALWFKCQIILTIALSGIASLLLPSGRTTKDGKKLDLGLALRILP